MKKRSSDNGSVVNDPKPVGVEVGVAVGLELGAAVGPELGLVVGVAVGVAEKKKKKMKILGMKTITQKHLFII